LKSELGRVAMAEFEEILWQFLGRPEENHEISWHAGRGSRPDGSLYILDSSSFTDYPIIIGH
jgi:hypothetical protein